MAYNPSGHFPDGHFPEGYFPDAAGEGEYTPATVTVRAFRQMFFGGELRQIGATFSITSPYQFTPYGMELVGSPPANWSAFMETYSKAIDTGVLRFPGRDETRIPSRRSSAVPTEAGNPHD